MSEVYYRLVMNVKPDGTEQVEVLRIERGEERAVNPELFIKGADGKPCQFDTHEEAVSWLNTYVKQEFIAPMYRVPKQEKFMTLEFRTACKNRDTEASA